MVKKVCRLKDGKVECGREAVIDALVSKFGYSRRFAEEILRAFVDWCEGDATVTQNALLDYNPKAFQYLKELFGEED